MSSILNKYIIWIVLIITFFPSDGYGQSDKWLEKDYANYIQHLIGGQREYSVESGRVDLLTDEFAYEIEWANKWKESIGQSIWYALQTNKKPAIILLIRSESDYKYFIQLNSALEYANLKNQITVYLFPNDFKESIEASKKEKWKRK